MATDSWVAAEAGDLTGDENTAAWAAAVRQGIQAPPSDGNVQAEAQKAAMDSFQTAQNARQSRILSSVWKLPTIVWLVLDLGAFVFAGLVVLSLPGRRRTAFVLIGACLLFTMGVVGALSMFATPFTRLGVSVQPTAVEGPLSAAAGHVSGAGLERVPPAWPSRFRTRLEGEGARRARPIRPARPIHPGASAVGAAQRRHTSRRFTSSTSTASAAKVQ